MYLEYWMLNSYPFENISDPDCFYASHGHEEALSRLVFVVTQGKGLAVVTGDIGCGKTMLAETLPSHLPPRQYRVIHMRNPALKPLDFLQMILMLFEVSFDNHMGKAKTLYTLERHLRNELDGGRRAALIVDEAQTIHDPATMDELRMLLNLQFHGRFLLNLILMGQKELEARIAAHPALSQRISVRFRLGPLAPAETVKYIQHRILMAGVRIIPFTPEAISKIHEMTRGVPREINRLCDRALLAGFLQKHPHIDTGLVEEAWKDIR